MTVTFLTGLLDELLMLENQLEHQKRVNLQKISHYRSVSGDPVVSKTLFSYRDDLLGTFLWLQSYLTLINIFRDLLGSDYKPSILKLS